VSPVLPEFEEGPIDFLTEGEEVTHQGGKVWCLVPASAIQQETWRPGHLYLTNKRLCWWYDFEKKLVFDVPVDEIVRVNTEMRKTSGLNSKKEMVLDLMYKFDKVETIIASFSGGEQLDEWAEALNRIVSGKINEEAEKITT